MNPPTAQFHKTKIVATIGPSSDSTEVLKEMILAGLDVVRLNCSHGSHQDFARIIQLVRALDRALDTQTTLLADLQGPKLRVGEIQNGSVTLAEGSEVTITTKETIGTEQLIYTNYREFAQDVKPGEPVLLDDGKLVLRVTNTNGRDEVKCIVVQGGVLSSRKGINLPHTEVSLPSLSEKDLNDLKFMLEQDVDWIGLSFVRKAEDVSLLREIIARSGRHAKVIAKMEKPEAIARMESIISAADGVMVARGDLGVEMPLEQVPHIQKKIIRHCLEHSKPVIVATQMMESMMTQLTPTRAEVNDVANAVLDGADAVMLSGETSVGKYPVEAIKVMNSIIGEAEKSESIYNNEQIPVSTDDERFITDSICYSACRLSKRAGAHAIVTMSFSGYTGYKISSQRPNATIYVFTANRTILSQMNLVWGVRAYYYDKMESTDRTIADIKQFLQRKGHILPGEFIIHIASMPINEQGMTNMLKLSKV